MTRILLSVCLLPLFSLPTPASGAPAGVRSDGKETLPGGVTLETLRYKGKVPKKATLVIENPFGDVHARFGGYEREVEIVASVQRLGRRIDLRVMTEGGKMIARVMEPPKEGDPKVGAAESKPGFVDRSERADRADLAVFVPKGVPVRIATRDGAIDCKKLESETTLESQSGAIKVIAGTGRLVATSERGDITATFDPGNYEGTSRLESRQGQVLAYVAETADMKVELKTAGEVATDYSIDLDYRRDQAPPKVAHAQIGKPWRLLVLESSVGKIGLYRIVKLLHKGKSTRKH